VAFSGGQVLGYDERMNELEAQRAALAAELLAWMGEGIPAPGTRADEGRFNRLALRMLAYQFKANEPYRRYCGRRGVRPGELTSWRNIPAVPTDAFKEVPLTCFPHEQAEAVFVTSGTTRQMQRGRHYLRSLDLYHASLLPNFAAHLLPDGARLPAEVLFFSPEAMPQSSLAHMFGVVVERLCDSGLGSYFVTPEGIDVEGATARLAELEAAGQPVLVMGTAFAFVHLLDHLTEQGRRLNLPPGSRLMDTGGYKGRSREVPKDELYAMYSDLLGIPDDHIVNEYGMTEMGSQFYDGVLRGATGNRQQATGGTTVDRARPRRKSPPPWVRTVVMDPETLTPVAEGQAGVLCHYDLANLDSVLALQTADLGYADAHGFEITGRAAGAEARGCSLAVEELLDAQRT
jgi:hypothetical protein